MSDTFLTLIWASSRRLLQISSIYLTWEALTRGPQGEHFIGTERSLKKQILDNLDIRPKGVQNTKSMFQSSRGKLTVTTKRSSTREGRQKQNVRSKGMMVNETCNPCAQVGVYWDIWERARIWHCFSHVRSDWVKLEYQMCRIQVHSRSLFLASLAGAGFLIWTEMF